jgi:hypothetical protein
VIAGERSLTFKEQNGFPVRPVYVNVRPDKQNAQTITKLLEENDLLYPSIAEDAEGWNHTGLSPRLVPYVGKVILPDHIQKKLRQFGRRAMWTALLLVQTRSELRQNPDAIIPFLESKGMVGFARDPVTGTIYLKTSELAALIGAMRARARAA